MKTYLLNHTYLVNFFFTNPIEALSSSTNQIRNKILYILFLSIAVNSFSQNEEFDLPNFSPPSPQSAAITQYGDQTINESTGKVTSSIPLYSFKSGNLELPISLDYLGNGVKVDQNVTWTGVNWTLNAGGAITRTVFDKPDEKAQTRVFEGFFNLPDYSNTNETDNAEAYYTLSNYRGNTYDLQPDIFSFSAMGLSGSFYLNEGDFEPILINASQHIKIEIVDGTNRTLSELHAAGNTNVTNRSLLADYNSFKITSPSGVEFYFGLNSVESTQLEQNHHTVLTPLAVTAYYLNEIRDPLHGIIYFEYEDRGSFKQYTSQSKTLIEYHKNELSKVGYPEIRCDNIPGKYPLFVPKNEISSSNLNATKMITSILDRKFLSRVHSPTNSIEILFSSNEYSDGGNNFDRILNSISINSNENLKEIRLEYLHDKNETAITDRFFLTDIKIGRLTSGSFLENELYTLQYNNPLGLPKRFSFAQDALGYYNGVDTNSNFFQSVLHTSDDYGGPKQVIGPLGGTADRSSNIDTKKYGSLEKIIYPTGGNTTFEYEGVLSKKIIKRTKRANAYRNNYPIEGFPGNYYQNKESTSLFIGDILEIDDDTENPSFQTNEIPFSQTVTINVFLQSQNQVYNELSYLTVSDFDTNEIIESIPIQMYVYPTSDNVQEFGFITERSYNYFAIDSQKVRITLTLPNNPQNSPMRGELSYTVKSGYELIDGEGLRVKRVIDNSTNQTSNIKRYYYTYLENVLRNPVDYAAEYKEPIFWSKELFFSKKMDWNPSNCAPNQFVENSLATGPSNSIGYLYSTSAQNYDQHVLDNYEFVTISYGGDNFELGGVEKQFIQDSGGKVTETEVPDLDTHAHRTILKTHTNASWLSLMQGKLAREIYVKRKNDTIYKVKEIHNEYKEESLGYKKGFLVSIHENFGPSINGPLYEYSAVGIGEYEIRSKMIALKKQETIDYIDEFPITFTGNTYSPYNNIHIYQGWQVGDHDIDGVSNFEDEDYLALVNGFEPFQYNESDYHKIISTTTYDYNSQFNGLPTKITTTSSKNNLIYETHNTYVDQAANIVNPSDAYLYENLKNENRISAPLKRQSYVNKNGALTLLSTSQTLYSNDNESNLVLPYKLLASKNSEPLEDRVEFKDYDSFGNVTDVRLVNGSITHYDYNINNQVIRKIENYTGFNSVGLPDGETSLDYCSIMEQYFPNSQVTYYFYDNTTHLLTRILDPRCKTVSYEYDEFHRLKYVKDEDGNILSKKEYNYAD